MRRYAHAETPETLITSQWQAGRPCILDTYAPYLLQRLAEGQSNATRLHEELTQLGYPGSLSRLRAYLKPLRAGHRPRSRQAAPSVRTVTSWLTRHPDRLDAQDRDHLDAILQRCPDLDATARHVRAFAEMMRDRAGTRLNAWMHAIRQDALPELHSFVAGIEMDYDAVLAALTQPYSSGVVEGHVNRISMWNLICQARAVRCAQYQGTSCGCVVGSSRLWR